MTVPLNLGIGLAQSWATPATDVAATCRRAELLGYDSIWLSDAGLGYAGSLEPLTTLAYAAAVTTRAQLGISVIVLPLRSPVRLAQALATIDQLSGGRLVVGLGIGRGSASDAAYGIAPGGRSARYDEAIEVLLAAWEGGPVRHSGQRWQLDGLEVHPKPLQQPRPPLWFGGGTPAALDRAARLGDGWTAAGSSAWSDAGSLAATMKAALERHGRDPDTFVVGKRVYLALEPDERRALAAMRDSFQRVYGRPGMADTVAIHGSADGLIEQLGSLLDHGYRFLLLNPAYDEAAQTEAIAEQVLPALRARHAD